MQFLSDNAARVHPAVWRALHDADVADTPYDGDALSARLDEAFSALFGRPCTALWVATGTVANALSLGALVDPDAAVICHHEAHINGSERGAPEFYTHGAKLIGVGGAGAKLEPAAIRDAMAGMRKDVHQIPPQAISISQTTEYGLVYRPDEIAALGAFARGEGMRLHMDGARFANAVAALDCSPAEASVSSGVDVLSFGCVKNGGMGAEAVVLFDPALAERVRIRRKRGGHLQSKGRYLAAQLLAMVEGGLWLDNARAANRSAAIIAGAVQDRLLYPAESNQVFVRLSPDERAVLRARGFGFYDWGDDGARIVTAWDNEPEHVAALSAALKAL